MHIVVADNPEIASRHAARLIQKLIQSQPSAILVLPTGSTPLPLYRLLITKNHRGEIDFGKITTFNLDEYVGLPAHHPQSYHRFMWDNLFSKINIKKSRVHIPTPAPEDSEASCAKYEAKLNQHRPDLAILGIGQNGHIAFNEPGTSFESLTHITNLDQSTLEANARFFKDSNQVPRQAMTMGLKSIARARHIFVLAFGLNKAQAVAQALEGPVTPDVPASVLQTHPHVTFLLDLPAASQLTRTPVLPPRLGGIRLYSGFNLPKNKTVAFFSPHPDDASICAGATLAALAPANHVHEIIATTGHRAVLGDQSPAQRARVREQEVAAEARTLGAELHLARAKFYETGRISAADRSGFKQLIQTIRPDIAFLPHRRDTHPTHILTRELALSVLPAGTEIWSFETPWGLFGHKGFNAAFEFGEDLMETKLTAIRHHQSQLDRTSFDDAAQDVAHFRRITIGEQFLSDLGSASLKTEPYLELFHITKSS